MKAVTAIALFIALIISGCGSKTGVQTSAQKAYIYFTGNTNNIVVSIDKGESFSVKAGQTNQYSVKPGKHLLEVTRDGVLIIQREIYVGDSIAKEIEIN